MQERYITSNGFQYYSNCTTLSVRIERKASKIMLITIKKSTTDRGNNCNFEDEHSWIQTLDISSCILFRLIGQKLP